MLAKLPALQFYPGDWRKDVGVQSLSFHDRGIWFEILMLMHESERRGVLVLNGKTMSDDALARILGLDKQILTTTLTELLSTGVASVEQESGALMNRRMVRDENLRQIRSEAGSKGGNPVLLNQKRTTPDKQNSTPSSSVSSSSSKEQTHPPDGGASVIAVKTAKPKEILPSEAVEDIYSAYPRKMDPRPAKVAIEKAVRRIAAGEVEDEHRTLREAAKWLLERTTKYAKSPFVLGTAEQYIPYPRGWFSGGSYLENEAWSRAPAANRAQPPAVDFNSPTRYAGSNT